MIRLALTLFIGFLLSACGGGPGPVLDENGRLVPFDANGNPITSSTNSSTSNTSEQTNNTPDDTTVNPTPTPAPLTSLQAFEQTLYPVLRNNCASCHATNVSPNHSSANSSTAHNVIINGNLVNFGNTAGSKLVTQIAGGHQGISTAIANQINSAIIQWDSKF